MADKFVVARALREIALLLEVDGANPFKVRAYERGARAVEVLREDVTVLAREGRLKEVPGIGAALASTITEIANTGRSATGGFDLQISGLAPLVIADGLEPGEERFVEADGPACEPMARVTAEADPLDLVDERNEGDNALTVRCP